MAVVMVTGGSVTTVIKDARLAVLAKLGNLLGARTGARVKRAERRDDGRNDRLLGHASEKNPPRALLTHLIEVVMFGSLRSLRT